MARLLVTVGSDGLTDWVTTPAGSKHNLGPVSVLKFVSKLSLNKRVAKQTLDTFLREGTAMLKVDEDQMWVLLAPRPGRWASDGPFIAHDQRTLPRRRKGTMPTLNDDLNAIEQHISELDKAAALGTCSPEHMQKGREHLGRLANSIKSPDQPQDVARYVLGDTHDDDVAHAPSTISAGEEVHGLAYDTYAQNTDLADQIISQGEVVDAKITALVAAGKSFNASQARADLHAVTSKVAGILRNVDLTTTWVQADLKKLAARSDEIHGLFAPAKV